MNNIDIKSVIDLSLIILLGGSAVFVAIMAVVYWYREGRHEGTD